MTTNRTTLAELHDLTGKVAIVTGGSRGIGRAIAQRLAEAGAEVVIASRKLDACEAAAEEITASTGVAAAGIACHVGRWTECDDLIAATVARFGRLDVLVSNAGMSPLYESLDAVTEEIYDKTHAVNLKGPFRLGVLAATHMAAHDGGAIINIGTAGSLVASVNELPYVCAKAGLNALTVGLARGVRPEGPGERDPPRPLPHRRQQGVGRQPRHLVRPAPQARGTRRGRPARLASGLAGLEFHHRHDHPRGRRHHPQGLNGVSTMDQLEERVAIVTGAASGLGLALAEHLAAAGMRVVITDIDGDAAVVERRVAPGRQLVPSRWQATASGALHGADGERHLRWRRPGDRLPRGR